MLDVVSLRTLITRKEIEGVTLPRHDELCGCEVELLKCCLKELLWISRLATNCGIEVLISELLLTAPRLKVDSTSKRAGNSRRKALHHRGYE